MSIVTIKDAEWLLSNTIAIQWWTIRRSIRPILLSANHFLLFPSLFFTHSLALFDLVQVCQVVLLFLDIGQLILVESLLLAVCNLIHYTSSLLSKVLILNSTLPSARVVCDSRLWSHHFLGLVVITSFINWDFGFLVVH